MNIKRSKFLAFAIGFFGFLALVFTSPRQLLRGKAVSYEGKKRMKVGFSFHKFVEAFKKKSIRNLPKNPVTY